MKQIMTKIINKLLVGFFLVGLTACSYSPNALKQMYSEFDSEISDEYKSMMDLSSSQKAMVDHYAKEMMKWHRSHKLPEYSQVFLKLASYIQQEDIPLPALQASLKKMTDMPHLHQATHLTPLVLDIAETLTHSQVNQLERWLKSNHEKTLQEIKTERIADEVNKFVNYLFTFMSIKLNSEQKSIVKAESLKFHDLRGIELQNDKKWDKQLIVLLKRQKSPQFKQQFTQLWNSQETKFQGSALQKNQQNQQRMAKMLRTLIMKFNTEKRNKLVSQLTSISNTLNEMAN